MPAISAKTKIYGVTGWPVEHSQSPQLQNAAIQAAGVDAIYVAFPIPPERFELAVRGLMAAGIAGLNCTIPHKYAAYAICDEVDPIAKKVGAVNTLRFHQGRIMGTNSDVVGYAESLKNDAHFDLQGASVVQLGAGGAGRGMAIAALEAGAVRLVIINRTLAKAESLAKELLEMFPAAQVSAANPADQAKLKKCLQDAQLVANATALGLAPGDPFPCNVADIPPGVLVFDAAYTAKRSTPWLEAAAAHGCRTLDGLGMLVRQGAASFRFWTGLDPSLHAMFSSLNG